MLICNTVSAQGSRDVIVSVPTLCIVCALTDKQCTSVQTGFGDAKSYSRLLEAIPFPVIFIKMKYRIYI